MKYAAIPPSIRLQMLAHAMKHGNQVPMAAKRYKPPQGHRKAKSPRQYANTAKAQQR